ncbi:hypothetical protein HQ544_03135 [Candidatus Falkowbacteria bacterium]|nr:hypothetical protein [Candidatus Falkowbacteria bacterium]
MKIKSTVKLGKNSKYSYDVCVPLRIVRALKLREKQKLVITGDTRTGKITIEDWTKPKKARQGATKKKK